ncbi:MAG: glycosyl hydrolase-related protein, partial [candidate division KSB1 bacterium]
IIRVQENHGANTVALITLPFAAAAVSEVNFLEWEEKPTNLAGARLAIALKPWEIKTLKVKKNAQ